MLPWILAGGFALLSIYLGISRHRTRRGIARVTDQLGQRGEIEQHGLESNLRKPAAIGNRHQVDIENITREAQNAEALFRNIVENFADGLLLLDEQLVVQFHNHSATRLFPRHQMVEGKALIECCGSHEIVNIARECIEHAIPKKGQITINSRNFRDEEHHDYHYALECIPLAQGCSLLVRDITDSIYTEQVRKDFVANASHELRTPLTLINGYIETLQEGGAENPQILERALEMMAKHGNRLALIIEDLLDLSKIESSNKVNTEAFDFGECTAAVVETISSALEAGKGEILELPEPGSCPFRGDRFLWDQILLNLLQNAIKENPNGIGLGVAWEERPKSWLIRVWDNGTGIPSAALPFIFKRFYRVEKHHSKSDIKGTGLGLSIVKRAVESQKGIIRVESTPGKRTEFFIEIPR